MQLCSDISTIFNFRRELLLKYLELNESSQVEILAADIKLTTKLIKDDPKSYTLWNHRQWLIQKLYKMSPKIVD
jgi:geranylgeranyl transferase type-2 subunit alpha